MCPSAVTIGSVKRLYKIPTQRADLVQSGHHHYQHLIKI